MKNELNLRLDKKINATTGDNYKRYLQDIKYTSIEYLTVEDEIRLFKQLSTPSDSKARAEIVRRSQPLVIATAGKYVNPNTSLEELISIGNLGLCECIDKFDLNNGIRFTSFAINYIRGGILHSFTSTNVIAANSLYYYYLRLKKIIDRLYSTLEREPSPEEVVQYVGDNNITNLNTDRKYTFNESHYNSLMLFGSSSTTSLEYTDGDEVINLNEVLASDEIPLVPRGVILEENIDRALQKLTDIEKKIISMQYGLGNYERIKIIEIIKVLNITMKKYYKIYYSALKKLQRCRSLKELFV